MDFYESFLILIGCLFLFIFLLINNKRKDNDITDLYKSNKKIKEKNSETVILKKCIKDFEEIIENYKRENKQLRIKLEKYEKKNND